MKVRYMCETCNEIFDTEVKAINCEKLHDKKLELVKQFVNKLLEIYPNLPISYKYEQDYDDYAIYHDSSVLEFGDENFRKHVGMLIRDIFYENDFYNFSFGYRFE